MKYLYLFLVCVLPAMAFAQESKLMEDGETMEYNGLRVGYRITNVSTREVGKEVFDRYTITAFVTNFSACEIGLRLTGNERPGFINDQMLRLAAFDCLNATGARLTSRSMDISLRNDPVYFTHRYDVKLPDGKTETRSDNIIVGYMLQRNRTRENSFIVIVPRGEKPQIRVTVFPQMN
ncbi:ABC transporter permease [Rhodoflexus caldus]|uniref:ABC transporter permease n=1 Tax=Rhodoflexus caldus TaxID=2891236 RepID=UPI00202AA698|nr:ABC transporter permease [Rhodoflexus caldus]